jgi:hypothetical protein
MKTVLKTWVALQSITLLVLALALFLPPHLLAEAAVMRDFRIGSTPEYVRMVLELDRPLNLPPSYSINRNTLRLTITGITNDVSMPEPGEYRDDIIRLDASKESGLLRIDAVFQFEPSDLKPFSLARPDRFIIDVYRPLAPTNSHQPDTQAPQGTSVREKPVSEEPVAGPEKSRRLSISQPATATPTDTYRLATPIRSNTTIFSQHRFEQRLLGALIVVTSIIVVLLIMLIWIGGGRKISVKRSWKHRLPPTKDSAIARIDAKINAHFETLTTQDTTSQVSACPDKKVMRSVSACPRPKSMLSKK